MKLKNRTQKRVEWKIGKKSDENISSNFFPQLARRHRQTFEWGMGEYYLQKTSTEVLWWHSVIGNFAWDQKWKQSYWCLQVTIFTWNLLVSCTLFHKSYSYISSCTEESVWALWSGGSLPIYCFFAQLICWATIKPKGCTSKLQLTWDDTKSMGNDA